MKKTINPNTAAIYARYSSHNQRDESLDAQIRACREFAEQQRLSIVKIYPDAAQTGTNAEREQFQLMIADSEKGLFSHIIVHKLDRFSRDRYDSVIYKRKLKQNRVTLLSVTERLDGSPESKMMEAVIEGMAQYYSANLGREIKKGQKETALKCQHLGGKPPLGYDVDPATKRYVINEAEAKIVRIIFERYSSDVGYKQILGYLNGMGYRTKNGKAFGNNSLNSILNNEKYVGRFIFNKMLEKDESGRRNPQEKPRDEWIIVEDGLPAIIDKEVFEKVQCKMVLNKSKGGRNKSNEVYLLSGLIHCGECGASLHGNTRMCGRGSSKYSSYRCSSKVQHKGCSNKELRKEIVEKYVLDELYRQLFSEESIKRLSVMLSEYQKQQRQQSSGELSEYQKILDGIKDEIDRIVRLVSESGISIDTVKQNVKELEERKHFIEDEISTAANKAKLSEISDETIENLIHRSKNFVKTRNISECRNFIDSYIKDVIVYEDRVEVEFKINVVHSNDQVAPLSSQDMLDSIKTNYVQIV